jgi:hypothetical protein
MQTSEVGNAQPLVPFWKTRKGIILHIVLVLAPSALFLQAGHLLLLGLLLSVAVAWIGMRFQSVSWADLGLTWPRKPRTVFIISVVATLGLIPATYALRQVVTAVSSQKPSLDAFQAIEGNITALLIGLVVVWTFAAFGEELLFRGFLLNVSYRLLEGSRLRAWSKSGGLIACHFDSRRSWSCLSRSHGHGHHGSDRPLLWSAVFVQSAQSLDKHTHTWILRYGCLCHSVSWLAARMKRGVAGFG